MTYPWASVRYTGASRDSREDRRRKLWAWRDGAIDLSPTDAAGTVLTPDVVDWSGCDRPPGRPAEAGSRVGPPVLVRVSVDERAELESAAGQAGEPLSTWIREAALRAARRVRG